MNDLEAKIPPAKEALMEYKNDQLTADYATRRWKSLFDCSHLTPLIICRGPVRKEAMEEFEKLGITDYGILLSEKDSIVHPRSLAPELRHIDNPERIHRVTDYSGADKAERKARIKEIIEITRQHGYNAIFAGYGFMAEDEMMVSAVEAAGLIFIGPCSYTVRSAGQKDEAKRIAESVGVTTIPGMDQLAEATLLSLYPTFIDLKRVADQAQLAMDFNEWVSEQNLRVVAHELLDVAMSKGLDLFEIDDLGRQAVVEIKAIYHAYPNNRVRLKAVLGGGGKGQRIVASPADFEGDLEHRIDQATAEVPALVQAILSEVKATGKGDNKNLLIELNIETTRHQEVQLVGNGEWAIALGARDCSLQMHEQKLVELSQTSEGLEHAIAQMRKSGQKEAAKAISADLTILNTMEQEAVRFAEAVRLDSVSTFECIVDSEQHFFMEMNTRIQVEHRVTELCYGLQFSDPDNSGAYFVVDTIVALMVLLACHKRNLPRPARVPKALASVELRLNATNQALQPHAGGEISYWSPASDEEMRDDQGISATNPDTGQFVSYTISGAYDSNIALLLTQGQGKVDAMEKMVEVVRRMRISGNNLETNLDFHYGVVNWLLHNSVHAKVTTAFIKPYLTLVGLVKQQVDRLSLPHLSRLIQSEYIKQGYSEKSVRDIISRKETLLLRPISLLIERPHILSGWLSAVKSSIDFSSGSARWLANPIDGLQALYHHLNMDWQPNLPAAYAIWEDDRELLQTATAFYRELNRWLGLESGDYQELSQQITSQQAPELFVDTGRDHGLEIEAIQAKWRAAQLAHSGYQMGMELLLLLPSIAEAAGFYKLALDEALRPLYPSADEISIETFETTETDKAEQRSIDLFSDALHKEMLHVLEPPPVMSSDQVVAVSGGMFYLQPAPDQPPFIKEGDRFEQGEPLYIIEVMKMFNTVPAPFSGTVEKILVDNHQGEIVKRGQPLFKVTPDGGVEQDGGVTDEERLRFSKRWVQTIFKPEKV